MRVLIVCAGDFSSPGEKQFLGFAQELVRRGHTVLMSINGDPSTADDEGAAGIDGLLVRAHTFDGRGLSAADRAAAAEFAPDLIHAINARVTVVAAARSYAESTGAPVAIHFEDNEWGYSRGVPGSSRLRLLAQAGRRLVSRARPTAWYYATPASLRWAQGQAAFDALTPALAKEVEKRLGRPCSVILPVLPSTPAPAAGRASIIPAELRRGAVCAFTGALFPQTADDVRIALSAVAEVQRRGHDATFVHIGHVLERVDADGLAREAGLTPGSWAFLGYMPFSEVPGFLDDSDILLSPGLPNEQNRLRLPSKVQAYLESGTPTITFAVGFGELLEDRVEAMLTHTGDPGELAGAIAAIIEDDALRATLREHGPAAARRLFDVTTNTDALVSYYETTIASAGRS